MNKYGIDNFSFEIIEETDDIESREKYWIQQLNTYGSNGYNATIGGDGKPYIQFTDNEIIEYHCSIAKYVAGRTASYFNIDPKSVKKILAKHNIKWLTCDECRDLLIKENGSFLCQIDPFTYSIISIYKSKSEANRRFNKNPNSGAICDSLSNRRGENTTAFGFLWRYWRDIPDEQKLKINFDELFWSDTQIG